MEILLITDAARLVTAFGSLAEDAPVKLRIANTLEAGGEELAHARPDVVFVQTHLSGLSADILLMHLKRMVSGEQPHYILMATPQQIGSAPLHQYQGWLDTTLDSRLMLPKILDLLSTFAAGEPPKKRASGTSDSFTIETVLLSSDESARENQKTGGYPPTRNLSVYSEFNNSFDNAVSATAEPETITKVAPSIDEFTISEQDVPSRPSKKRSRLMNFMLCLVPVVLAVTVVTYVQESWSPQQTQPAGESNKTALKPLSSSKGALPRLTSAQKTPQALLQQPVSSTLRPLPPPAHATAPSASSTAGLPLKKLPEFISRSDKDTAYSSTHPQWDRYVTRDVEYRVYKDNDTIKAIQAIARGGIYLSKDFLDSIFRQVAERPAFILESSSQEKDFMIERGHVASNISLVYYRDKQSGGLKAFVLTWR